MKKCLSLVLLIAFALSLSACAAGREAKKTRVKCPACGYEFEVPETP